MAIAEAPLFDLEVIRDASTLELEVLQDWHIDAINRTTRQKLIEINVVEWWPGFDFRVPVRLIVPLESKATGFSLDSSHSSEELTKDAALSEYESELIANGVGVVYTVVQPLDEMPGWVDRKGSMQLMERLVKSHQIRYSAFWIWPMTLMRAVTAAYEESEYIVPGKIASFGRSKNGVAPTISMIVDDRFTALCASIAPAYASPAYCGETEALEAIHEANERFEKLHTDDAVDGTGQSVARCRINARAGEHYDLRSTLLSQGWNLEEFRALFAQLEDHLFVSKNWDMLMARGTDIIFQPGTHDWVAYDILWGGQNHPEIPTYYKANDGHDQTPHPMAETDDRNMEALFLKHFLGGDEVLKPATTDYEIVGTQLNVRVKFTQGPQAESGRIWWMYDREIGGTMGYLWQRIPDNQWMDMTFDAAQGVWTAAIPLNQAARTIDFFSNHGLKSHSRQTYLSSAYTRIDLNPTTPEIVSTETMQGWIQDLYEIGIAGKYGYRLPGTPAAHKGAEYIVEKFKEFGLANAFIEQVDEPLSMPEEWKLTVHAGGSDKVIPSHFLRYAGFTPAEGLSARMVYVGQASEAELEAAHEKHNLAGKIIVVDLEALESHEMPEVIFSYDPGDTIPSLFIEKGVSENWPIANLSRSYAAAQEYGAAGFVGILNFSAKDNNQFLHWYANQSIPGLFISRNEGLALKRLLKQGNVDATMLLVGKNGRGPISHVFGQLPGLSNETIMIHTHHDGWAVNEASGVAVVLALAEYFSKIPKEQRARTLQFVALDSHFGRRTDRPNYWLGALTKAVAGVNIEMIGEDVKIVNGEYVRTGLNSPTLFGVRNGNKTLVAYARDAIVKHDLRRTAIVDRFFGEAGIYWDSGLPMIERIAHNAPQFTQDDTPEYVMEELLRPTVAAFVDIVHKLETTRVEDMK